MCVSARVSVRGGGGGVRGNACVCETGLHVGGQV